MGTENFHDTNVRFVHLHVHSSYSFLDGYNPAKKASARAKNLGMTAIAITDHNHLGGVIEWQKECQEHGIKPILGLEAYWTWDTDIASLPIEKRKEIAIEKAKKAGAFPEISSFEINKKTGKPKKAKELKQSDIKEIIADYLYDMTQYHIILLAKNQTGWKNLVKLQSEAAEKCTFNGRFLCDDKMLEKYKDGIIMTTACISNAAADLLIEGVDLAAFAQLRKWHDIFKDDFYLEIQPLNIEKQWIVNNAYMKFAKETNIKTIATNDCHWTNKEDYDDHDTLLCIGTGKFKDDFNRMRYSDDFWIKSYDEMVESFEKQTESMAQTMFINSCNFNNEEYREYWLKALANTVIVANKISPNIKLGSDTPLFPVIDLPNGMTPEKKLIFECSKNLYKYLNVNPDLEIHKYEKRLEEELSIINKKGFAPYMLAVQEYVDWANKNDCPTGPGRGSAAGSLTLFLLGITKNIDPIKYDLLFSRFLTMDRSEPPDIDIDFDYNNRNSVIDHLEDKYGKEKVAHIGNYTYMGVKSGLKDVGRVLRIDFNTMNTISKKLDEILNKPQPKFKDYDKLKETDNIQWQKFNQLEQDNKEVFRLARNFEGNPRNMGTHASGILVTPCAVDDLFPTRKDKNGATVTLYTGKQLDKLSALKFDILGLKTISVITNALKSISETMTIEDLYEALNINDQKIFEMIRNKETDGLFQIESDMFKDLVKDIQPDSLNDIIAITALGRPGPLSAGMHKEYAACKHGFKEVEEPLPNTLHIVNETYGQIIYQEEFMKMIIAVSGFNANQSDSIGRKIVGKKERENMEMLRRMIIYGKCNTQGPPGWKENQDSPWYDPDEKYGDEIKGALKNGYTKDQMNHFWKTIQGFIDYCFNKSHAACYSYITLMTAYLKKYFPVEFMASLLTMEETEEKKDKYIKVAKQMGIEILPPDINKSNIDFTPVENSILYGLGSIKGVGATSIPAIIENRPYESLEDVCLKVNKKSFNKTVGTNLIKAGALDAFETNRHKLINKFYSIRKEKEGYLDEDIYDDFACMNMEVETLGSSITFAPWWETIKNNEKLNLEVVLISNYEKKDKNNNLMAFPVIHCNNCEIRSVVFSSKYCKFADVFEAQNINKVLVIEGIKDDNGSLIIRKAKVKKETLEEIA